MDVFAFAFALFMLFPSPHMTSHPGPKYPCASLLLRLNHLVKVLLLHSCFLQPAPLALFCVILLLSLFLSFLCSNSFSRSHAFLSPCLPFVSSLVPSRRAGPEFLESAVPSVSLSAPLLSLRPSSLSPMNPSFHRCFLLSQIIFLLYIYHA